MPSNTRGDAVSLCYTAHVLEPRYPAAVDRIVDLGRFYDLTAAKAARDEIVALTEEASHVAIPLRKGEETASLREAIDKAIEELRAEGTLTELSEKYFGQDISSEN